MRKPDMGFMPREIARGVYKFQAVRRIGSRNGIDQVKTLFPHARLASEVNVAHMGFDTALLIEQVQRLRTTVPGGEAARRRSAVMQVTLMDIDRREKGRLQRDLAELDEIIDTASKSIAFSGDPDGLFHTNYPNVADQYRDFDIDPDRQEHMFLRTEEYRLSQHNERQARKQEKPRARRRRVQREQWEAFGGSGPFLEDNTVYEAKLEALPDVPADFTETRLRKEGLPPIQIPVPPMLERVVGYEGDAPFVALHWSDGADKAYYNDGAFAGTGDSWGYLAYIRHPAVFPILAASRINLGYSDREAEHALVLDRQGRKMYVATMTDVEAFLNRYRPPLLDIDMEEFLRRVREGLAELARQPLDHDAIMRAMQDHSRLIGEMTAWLDGRIDNRQN